MESSENVCISSAMPSYSYTELGLKYEGVSARLLRFGERESSHSVVECRDSGAHTVTSPNRTGPPRVRAVRALQMQASAPPTRYIPVWSSTHYLGELSLAC
jgi:hypothetical protein